MTTQTPHLIPLPPIPKVSKDLNPLVKSFLAGSLSGTCSTVLFQPFDVIKTRLQQNIVLQSTSGQVGMLRVAHQVVTTENVVGLWRGIVPSVARTVPGVGLYFGSLHWMKMRMTEKPSAIQAICMGMAARSLSACVMIPMTVVKTRFESNTYNYARISTALWQIYSKEGLHGLSCGLVPTLVRDAPYSGLYLMFYTQLKQHLLPALVSPNHKNNESAASFGCGVAAGFMASLVTQPADVIKTKMQLRPDLFGSVCSTARHVCRSSGLSGFLVGLAPRMIRRTFMSALSWTVYEEVSRRIGLK